MSRPDAAESPPARVPESPGDLTRRTWAYVARRAVHEFRRDNAMDEAAGLTFYAVLALFPAMIALLSLVGLVGQAQRTVDTVLSALESIGVGQAVDTLRPVLEALASETARPGLAFGIGLGTALLSASGYVASFGRAMNRIYEVEEGRPFWKLRPAMLLVTLGLVVLAALVLLGLVVSGPVARAVGEALGVGPVAVTAFDIAKWPVMLAAVAVIVAVLYHATPNVEQPRWRWVSVGAVVAILTWVVASLLLGLYVGATATYERTYGALAGVVVVLLWLWVTNLALLLGAELDAELERGRELQQGLPAEESLLLPVRDTTRIEALARRQQQEVDEGRRLRASAGRPPSS